MIKKLALSVFLGLLMIPAVGLAHEAARGKKGAVVAQVNAFKPVIFGRLIIRRDPRLPYFRPCTLHRHRNLGRHGHWIHPWLRNHRH